LNQVIVNFVLDAELTLLVELNIVKLKYITPNLEALIDEEQCGKKDYEGHLSPSA